MSATSNVTVEFFGIPRLRAGRSELAVSAATLLEAMLAIERACPGLEGLVRPDGRLAAHYLLSIAGQRFEPDLNHSLQPGDRLLLLSADAGG